MSEPTPYPDPAPQAPSPLISTDPAPASFDATEQPPSAGRPPFLPDPSLDGMPAGIEEPFAPPSDAWRRVSPKLTTVKRINASAWLLPPTVAGSLAIWFLLDSVKWAAFGVAAAGLIWWLWLWLRAPRVVAAYGWAQRDNDLCVVSGLMFKSLTIVPFGRMQTIKVTAGPLLRARGLANVEFVTASASTDASVPGMPADEAKELRDLMIELSDAEGSGL
ncbi:MAG: PH domain-containing protein [Propioniciclava sp.]|uniref:PH domain-containing protein n=1 Tax=Propioniciclava sp. TaxID=2038686 RepID=UPI0039E35607